MGVEYFENIQAKPERETILIRLGYAKGKTELNEYDSVKIGSAITMGLSLCSVKGAYGRYKILANDFSSVEIKGGHTLKSAKLADLLKDSRELVLMASTAGKEILLRREKEMMADNASLGVILDAVASESADAGLNWLQEHANTLLRRESDVLTKRFSPGYGDLDLSAQKIIHDLLDLTKIGVDITDKYILVPEKSVIAIAGIAEGR